MRTRSQVLWRREGESQVGVDGPFAVVLENLSPAEQRLVERLERGGTMNELLARGRELGVPSGRVREVLGILTRAGALLDSEEDPVAVHTGMAADLRHFERAGHTNAAAMLLRRREATVAIIGLSRIGLLLAQATASAGVGTVLVTDPREVRSEDAGFGALTRDDVGHRRDRRAAALLRAGFPAVRTSAPPGARPDLVVVVEQDVNDLRRLRRLLREDVPHLLVVSHEVDVAIGPLVRPGVDACGQCVALHHTDADECWPALATQLLGGARRDTETSLAWRAAAATLDQVLAWVDGRDVLLAGTSMYVSEDPARERRHRWRPHHRCGCTGPGVHDETSGVGAVAGTDANVDGGTDAGSDAGGSRVTRARASASAAARA